MAVTTEAGAQRDRVATSVTTARRSGDEVDIVALGEQIGPAGVAECLEHAARAGRLVCAQAARYIEQPWAVLPVLAAVLRDHDRQVASRAAESMVAVLSQMHPGDLGEQEALPSEVESLLEGLRGMATARELSRDIRAQIVVISGYLAILTGAGLAVARQALTDSEVAVRRAALSALVTSSDADDIAAMSRAAVEDQDLVVSTLAAAGVCEATLSSGRGLPSEVEARIRGLLEDESLNAGIAGPLLTCLLRASGERAEELQGLAARHPNESTRELWTSLTGGGEQ